MAHASNMGLERYDMTGKREALMLCVMKGNQGGPADLQIMKTFFKDFGFVSEFLIDGSVQEMREKLRSFRDRINRSDENISCVLVATSSHGVRKGIIDPYQKELQVEEILQNFSDQQCPKLKGKPKIFMFDACRGHLKDPGVSADREKDRRLQAQLNEQMKKEKHRVFMKTYQSPWIHDMILFYPTRPDFVAWMTTEGSSMFVKMAEVLASADTENEHLRDLFVKVNKKMVNEDIMSKDGIRKNVMTTESTLSKLVYLGRRRGSSAEDTRHIFLLSCFLACLRTFRVRFLRGSRALYILLQSD
ncbi:caspase-14-like [Pempheris klunzingeri]|uniref:caspase-14-like n=1 Tax=Pempheris klunzingeri TaxID=3127111 RepID=UPI00397F87E8